MTDQTRTEVLEDADLDAVSGGYRPKPVIVTSYSTSGSADYSGPTLTAKGGGDVAMEEVTLNYEEIKWTY